MMNGFKPPDLRTSNSYAVRAISGALEHSDSVASSVARQLPVALITTSGCQFCAQVSIAIATAPNAFQLLR